MNSKTMRDNPLFTRNNFYSVGKYGIPLVVKQPLVQAPISIVACSDTRAHDNQINIERGVHFFVDDYRFQGIYNNPDKTLKRYSQYKFLLTPDYSTYADMPLWLQIQSVAKNRWVGAYWQSKGNLVYPTVSWSTAQSYEFCFDGIEQNATVAVGTIGCRHSKISFMRGYDAMLERLNPENIIVFGIPFTEMRGNIYTVDYLASRKVVR